mmetsp:Transcript_84114/g.151838  ORF Transcript_84114/g.151838 Transcript_84114/m.151838 type:complete len:268 (-) Transcript_84114:91-894(-)
MSSGESSSLLHEAMILSKVASYVSPREVFTNQLLSAMTLPGPKTLIAKSRNFPGSLVPHCSIAPSLATTFWFSASCSSAGAQASKSSPLPLCPRWSSTNVIFGNLLEASATDLRAEEQQHHSQSGKPAASRALSPARYDSERQASSAGIGGPRRTTRPPFNSGGSLPSESRSSASMSSTAAVPSGTGTCATQPIMLERLSRHISSTHLASAEGDSCMHSMNTDPSNLYLSADPAWNSRSSCSLQSLCHDGGMDESAGFGRPLSPSRH